MNALRAEITHTWKDHVKGISVRIFVDGIVERVENETGIFGKKKNNWSIILNTNGVKLNVIES